MIASDHALLLRACPDSPTLPPHSDSQLSMGMVVLSVVALRQHSTTGARRACLRRVRVRSCPASLPDRLCLVQGLGLVRSCQAAGLVLVRSCLLEDSNPARLSRLRGVQVQGYRNGRDREG